MKWPVLMPSSHSHSRGRRANNIAKRKTSTLCIFNSTQPFTCFHVFAHNSAKQTGQELGGNMLSLLSEESSHKNRKPNRLTKYPQCWQDNHSSLVTFIFNIFQFSFYHEHMLFYSQGEMYAVFKRKEEKEDRLASPDGGLTSRAVRSELLLRVGKCLDSTASVGTPLPLDIPKGQITLWALNLRLSHLFSPTFEHCGLKILNLSMCRFPICKTETQTVPTSWN